MRGLSKTAPFYLMNTHTNDNGTAYFSKTTDNGEKIFSFTQDFTDYWSQDDQDLHETHKQRVLANRLDDQQSYHVSYCTNRQEGEPDTQDIMTGAEIADLQRNAAFYGHRLEISTYPVSLSYRHA